ncbi:MAG: diguanylate cyclase [Gammaproteobacteria bacterium]|nr:diguanylate cyclase [Gammaproteobacteria bacterium]
MRGSVGMSLLIFAATLCLPATEAAEATSQLRDSVEIRLLGSAAPDSPAGSVTSGALDAYFEPLQDKTAYAGRGSFWLSVRLPEGPRSTVGIPVLVIHAARQTRVELFAAGAPVPLATTLAAFRGIQDRVYVVPTGLAAGSAMYARFETSGIESHGVSFSAATLGETLARGAEHARMIALTVGALLSMALAALLIWFVLTDTLFVLYSTFFFLEALYIAYLSGQGFDWPVLSYAQPLTSFAWNVPVGLGGAVGCLFAREIADLKESLPRVYKVFGGFAAAFLAVTCANIAKLFGFAWLVSAVGNLIFFAVSVFTLVVVFWSWRRGNRAAGWFLIAWTLLDGFAIAAAVRFLITASDDNDLLLYFGLPMSMVAAAVLVALGVADRLRQQRAALTDAERRAQTDPLTGVLNRRSLVERLEAACSRARARGLPVSLLFIDLDHFKLINDSFGHQAGDACLRAIIEPIHAELRQSDVIGRYGGEEFVVILSSADAAAAHPIAQRILERVASVRVEGFGQPIGLTCSIGVAASDTLGVWGEHLVALADAAVYTAKRLGRNQVQMAAPPAG